MAERYHYQVMDRDRHEMSGKTRRVILMASFAGAVMGGPLLVMMGFSFLASLTLLLVTSPLLIIFSPILFGAGCIFAFAMAGFALAACLGLAGLLSISWVFKDRSEGGLGLVRFLNFNTVDGMMSSRGPKLKMDYHHQSDQP